MIPLIYDRTKVVYDNTLKKDVMTGGLNNLGIGEVSEAISCVVTEERNGGFTMSMTVPETAQYLDQLNIGTLLCVDASPQQKRQLFEIAKVTKNLKGQFTIYAEHISYRLLYSILKPFTETGLNNVLTHMGHNANGNNQSTTYYVQGNGFEFNWDWSGGAAAAYTLSEYQSVKQTLLGSSGSVLDKYGGCYKWDNWTVTLYKERGADNGVKILYGKNLTDITAEYNNETEATANGVLPIYKKDDSIIIGSIATTSNRSLYTYGRTIVKDFTSDITVEDGESTSSIQTKLNTRAASYVSSNLRGVPDVNLKTSFVLLSDTVEYAGYANLESVEIDDTVHVYVPTLDVDVKAKVIKTNYNVLMDRYDSVEVGNFRTSINQAIRAVKGG